VLDADGVVTAVRGHPPAGCPPITAGERADAALGEGWLGEDGGAAEALAARGVWTVPLRDQGETVPGLLLVVRQRYVELRPVGLQVDVVATDDDGVGAGVVAGERLARLNGIGVRLIGAASVDEIGLAVCEEVVPAIGAFGGAMVLADDHGLLRTVAAVGYPASQLAQWSPLRPTDAVSLAAAFLHREPVWLSSLAERDRRFPALAGATVGSRSLCAVPLRLNGPAFGAVGFSFGMSHPFAPVDRNFILAVGHQCALAADRVIGRDPSPVEGTRVVLDGALSPALVRRAVRLVAGGLDERLLADAQLCASELVTNAVLHAGSPVRAEVQVRGTRIRIEVADHSELVPTERPVGVPYDPAAPGGWGLAVVASLAHRWGTAVHARGKRVWAELSADADRADG
jgi:hypothetical protein